MAYTELQADIISTCQRSDIASIVPTWCALARSVFNRELRCPEMESRDQRDLDSEFSALPVDFLEIIAVVDEDSRELKYLNRQQFAGIVASGAEPDVPIFTIEDYQIRVYPAPTVSEPLTVTILYYEMLSELSAGSDTNWLLTDYPDLYLYGALVHAGVWLRDSKLSVDSKALRDEGIAALKRRKVAATGTAVVLGNDVPLPRMSFDITSG